MRVWRVERSARVAEPGAQRFDLQRRGKRRALCCGAGNRHRNDRGMGALAQRWIIRALSKPIRDLSCFFDDIVANIRPQTLQSTLPEFASVMTGAHLMMNAIDTRQRKLNDLINGQQKILEFTNHAQQWVDTDTLICAFVNLIQKLQTGLYISYFGYEGHSGPAKWFSWSEHIMANSVDQNLSEKWNNFANHLEQTNPTQLVEILDSSELLAHNQSAIRFCMAGEQNSKLELVVVCQMNPHTESKSEFLELLKLALLNLIVQMSCTKIRLF